MAQTTLAAPAVKPKSGLSRAISDFKAQIPHGKLQRREMWWGIAFLSPWLIGLGVLWLLPMAVSLYYSFTNYNPVAADKTRIIGLDNYIEALTDPIALHAAFVTLRYSVIVVPFSIIVPLLIAMLVNAKNLKGKTGYRMLFYLPTIIPAIAATLIFLRVFNSQTGWINRILGIFGIEGPSWFYDASYIPIALTILSLWYIGGAMIAYIAALQNVPTELYEAATVDGASPVRRFLNITLPMISPVIFFQLVFGVIAALQYFGNALLIGGVNGNPNRETLFYNVFLYRAGWIFNEMGYASALAWLLFLFASAITIALFATQRKWVYYASGD
jgi:multiple sugar transport system permease protein